MVMGDMKRTNNPGGLRACLLCLLTACLGYSQALDGTNRPAPAPTPPPPAATTAALPAAANPAAPRITNQPARPPGVAPQTNAPVPGQSFAPGINPRRRTNSVATPPSRPPSAVSFAPQPMPADPSGSPQVAPINVMLMQPGIDIDSPVAVFSAFDPPVATRGERITYRLVVTAMNESVNVPTNLPAPAGLAVALGGRGQNYASTGQKLQPRTSVNYRITPLTNGVFTMPPFEITVYGKKVKVPEARLEVREPNQVATREAPRLVVQLPPEDFYAGQSFNVKIILLVPQPATILGLSQVQVLGEGFTSDPMSLRQRHENTVREGKPYTAMVCELTITPIYHGTNSFIAQVHAIINPTGIPTGPNMPFYQPLLDSDPVQLLVRSLPKEGELPGFTGGIGRFMMDTPKLSAAEVRAGDPVTLSIGLRGDGNLARLGPPRVVRARDWQMFPPTTDVVSPTPMPAQGLRSFVYTLIPLSDRARATPAIPFSFFDPQKKSYVDLTIPPVALRVLPAPAGAVAALQPQGGVVPQWADGSGDKDHELTMTGLAEIPGWTVATLAPLQRRPWFLALQAALGAGLAGLWAWERRRQYLAHHPEVILKCRARRGLRRQLKRLRLAAAGRDLGGFVTAAVQALREACAPHSAATPEALVGGDVLRELPPSESRRQEEAVVAKLFQAADALQYRGATAPGEALFELQPALENILAKLKARL